MLKLKAIVWYHIYAHLGRSTRSYATFSVLHYYRHLHFEGDEKSKGGPLEIEKIFVISKNFLLRGMRNMFGGGSGPEKFFWLRL